LELPNRENAFIDMRKLRDYALDPLREEGGGKAHVFEVALGITQGDAEYLESEIQKAILTQDAKPTQNTIYGQKFELQFDMLGLNRKTAKVLTVWIIRHDEDFPRLVTTYVI
jgi:hypothetical protein